MSNCYSTFCERVGLNGTLVLRIDLAASCLSSRRRSGKMFQRIGGNALRCAGRRPIARKRLYDRKFSAYTSNASTAAPSSASPLGTITVELDRVAPRFEVPASKITILDSPASFYTTLKVSRNGAVSEDHCLLLTNGNSGQDTECQETHLSLYFIHRQSGA